MLTPLRILVGLAMMLPEPALAEPSPVPAEPSTRDALAGLLVVRVDMEGGEQVADELQPQILVALHDAEVGDELPESAPLEVVIAPDAENLGAYHVAYLHRGEQIDEWSCACSGDELVLRLQRTTVNVWNAVISAEVKVEAAAAPTPTVELEPAPPLATAHDRKKAGRLWLSGLALLPIGAGFVTGSTAVLIVDATDDQPASPTLLGLFGAGIVITSVAIPLWAVGRKRLYHPKIAFAPASRGRGLVLSLGGRF